jgi:tetratricopeptide (TPR) repeat protein
LPSQTPSASSRDAGDAKPEAKLRSDQRGLFRNEGEYWSIGSGTNAFRLKGSKGLAYVAHLLRHPGTEFHVLDLVGGIAGGSADDEISQLTQGLPRADEELAKAGMQVTNLGDAGEMLDEQAKADYRRRLSELREELEDAKESGKVNRAELVEAEIEALTRELSRAVGLGGRNRRAASASERARQSTTKAIKAVLERVAQSDATLGRMLSRCIRTGAFCSYHPDPSLPIAWEFAGGIIEPAAQPHSGIEPVPPVKDYSGFSGTASGLSPFSIAERTAFVDRQRERDAIRASIEGALDGHGSLLMLGGGPGVGKTRLATEMAEHAQSLNGFRALVGHCYEREEPFPYLPFAEIIENSLAQAASLDDFRLQIGDNAAELAQVAPSLRRVFQDIDAPLDMPPPQKRRYLFQSFSDALGRWARVSPQLFVLDDLQWADESTLALLVHLAGRVSQLRVAIIGTYRDEYLESNPALVRTLEELIRLGIRPLKLGGLSKPDVGQILQGLSGRPAPEKLLSTIFEESQGNPFFVEEVYRHLIEEDRVFDAAGEYRTDIEIAEIDVPENVRLVIGRRLQRFDEDEKRVLAAAAVIGRSFSFRLLTAVTNSDVDELFEVIEKAQRMAIVIASSEGPDTPFRFAHELVRQTLLGTISSPRRQLLHAAVAGAIERIYPGAVDEYAGEIAHHLLNAGSFADRHSLIHWLTQAGKGALEAAAFEEARSNFQSALRLQDTADGPERANLLTYLAAAERGLERWDPALTNLNETLEMYLRLGNREMIGRSFAELTDALIWSGRIQRAIEMAGRGLAYLGGDVSIERVRLLDSLGHAHAAVATYEAADEALREALNLASRLSNPKLMASVLGARSIVNFNFFRLREAADDGSRSEELGGSESPPWQRALQLRVLHQTLVFLGRPEEAAAVAAQLEPLARKLGQTHSVALCNLIGAWVHCGASPDLRQFRARLEQISKFDQDVRYVFWEVLWEAQISLAEFYRGNWADALAHAQASHRSEPGISLEGLGAGAVFRQLAYSGDRAGALAIINEPRVRSALSSQQGTRGSWLMVALVIEGLVILGERSRAAQLYPLARALVDTQAVALWPVFRFTYTVAGMAAAAAGEWEAAQDYFQTALRQTESFPHLLEQAEIQRFRAMMLMDRSAPGDRETAQKSLTEALHSYASIGMRRHVELTQALINQTAIGRE